MDISEFDKLVEYVVNERIKGVMCAKSAEYARGGDKLHNFKRAADVSNSSPLECLQGMKLKHDVSILDMLNDEVERVLPYTKEKWEEKISDDINYLILMLALLYEKYGWTVPGTATETKPGYGGDVVTTAIRKGCTDCDLTLNSLRILPCRGCYGTEEHKNWEPKT